MSNLGEITVNNLLPYLLISQEKKYNTMTNFMRPILLSYAMLCKVFSLEKIFRIYTITTWTETLLISKLVFDIGNSFIYE